MPRQVFRGFSPHKRSAARGFPNPIVHSHHLGELVTMQVSDPTGKGEHSFCQDQNLLEALLGSVTNSDSNTPALEVAELGDSESERMLGWFRELSVLNMWKAKEHKSTSKTPITWYFLKMYQLWKNLRGKGT